MSAFWLTHLEHQLRSLAWKSWLDYLSRRFTLTSRIRADGDCPTATSSRLSHALDRHGTWIAGVLISNLWSEVLQMRLAVPIWAIPKHHRMREAIPRIC